MAEAGRIHVELETRLGKLEANLKQAEQMVAGTSARMAKSSAFDLGGIKNALRLFGAIRAIEGAIQVVNIGVEAFRGNWDKAQDIVKTLPFGIGQLASAIEGLVKSVSGVAALEEDAKRRDQERIENQNQLNKSLELREKLTRDIALAEAASDAERKRLSVKFEQEDIGRSAAGLPGGIGLTERSQRLAAAKLAAISRDEEADRIEAFNKEMDKRQEAAQKALDKQRDTASRIMELDAQIISARLEGEGKVDQAARFMIEARYAKQIQLAETAAERERLLTLKNLELAQIKVAAPEAKSFAAVQVALSRSALTEGGPRAAAAARRPIEVDGFDTLISLIRDVKERLKPQTSATVALAG